MLIGVISDTHGLVRPDALGALCGSEMIIHAGDVGRPDVIDALNAIAPVRAVRGNVDSQPWAARFPMTDTIKAGRLSLFVIHDIADLDFDPASTGHAAVKDKGERFVLMVTGALAVWNVGIAFVVGVAAYWLNKKGFLRV